MSTLRFTRRVAIGAACAALVALAAGGAAEAGIAYSPDDVLYVAYVPGGREFIADLGPRSQFTGATGAFDIGRFSALDVKAALGDPLPATINAAVFGIDDTTSFDAYLASRGPSDTSLIGNAFGASNQIFGFGALLSLARPVAGNPNAGFYLASDNFSYQRTLNGAHRGSLGGNVPFNVETSFMAADQQVPLFFGLKDPTFGSTVPPQIGLIGTLTLKADGTLAFQPVRRFQISGLFGPGTFNVRSKGVSVSFTVTATEVTDPASPMTVDPSAIGPIAISSVGGMTLPTPSTAPDCLPSQDGIWESHRVILSPASFAALFDTPSDGNCQTLDGGRQDVAALLMDALDGTSVSICFKTTIDGQTLGACGSTRVNNKSTR